MSDQVSFHLFGVEYGDLFCESLIVYSRDKLQLDIVYFEYLIEEAYGSEGIHNSLTLSGTNKVLGMRTYRTNSTFMYSGYEFSNLTPPTHRRSP